MTQPLARKYRLNHVSSNMESHLLLKYRIILIRQVYSGKMGRIGKQRFKNETGIMI